VLLNQQNRARWDHLLIRRGLAALHRAQTSGASARQLPPFKPPLPPAMPAAPPLKTPTGRTLPRSTPCLCVWHPHRWSNSTARSPCPCTKARLQALAIVEALLQDKSLQRYHLLHAVHA
jgi:hypothetical protein